MAKHFLVSTTSLIIENSGYLRSNDMEAIVAIRVVSLPHRSYRREALEADLEKAMSAGVPRRCGRGQPRGFAF